MERDERENFNFLNDKFIGNWNPEYLNFIRFTNKYSILLYF